MNTALKTDLAKGKSDKTLEIRPTYLEALTLVERLHRRLLDVIKDEFDRRGRSDVNSVQALLLYNIGEGRSDATCADRDISVPHVIVGTTAKTSERLFASGNERTPLVFPDASQLKIGYQLNKNDKFAMLIDLMNTEKVDKTAYLTITYDIVDGHPPGWDHLVRYSRSHKAGLNV